MLDSPPGALEAGCGSGWEVKRLTVLYGMSGQAEESGGEDSAETHGFQSTPLCPRGTAECMDQMGSLRTSVTLSRPVTCMWV